MAERGSQREYARHRGVSHVAVGKAVKSGRISLDIDGKIDFKKADAAWIRNTDQIKQASTGGGEKTRKVQSAPRKPMRPLHENLSRTVTEPPAAAQHIDGGGVSLMKAQTMKAVFAAQREKLRFEEESGKKIDADDVRVRAFNRARRARDMILSAPARIAPLLVGMDILGITLTLEEEFRRVVEEISRDAASV